MLFLVITKVGVVTIFINPFLNPVYTLWMTDKHILQAYGFAVDTLQVHNDISQFCWTNPYDFTSRKYRIEVFMGQSKIFNGKGRFVFSTLSYWVGTRKKVSTSTVTVNKFYNTKFFENSFRNIIAGIFSAIFYTKVKSLEKGTPAGLYAIRVYEILVVKLRKMSRMGCIEKRILVHLGVIVLNKCTAFAFINA